MKLKKLALIGAVAGMMTSGAFAATADGQLEVGATATTPGSTGTLDLRLNVPDRVQISGLAGNAGLTAGELELTATDPTTDPYVGTLTGVCVYRNFAGANNVQVSATSSVGTAFALKNAGPDEIAYTAVLGGTTLTGTAQNYTTAATTDPACGTGGTVSLVVTATNAAVAAAEAGSYADILEITVTAN